MTFYHIIYIYFNEILPISYFLILRHDCQIPQQTLLLRKGRKNLKNSQKKKPKNWALSFLETTFPKLHIYLESILIKIMYWFILLAEELAAYCARLYILCLKHAISLIIPFSFTKELRSNKNLVSSKKHDKADVWWPKWTKHIHVYSPRLTHPNFKSYLLFFKKTIIRFRVFISFP